MFLESTLKDYGLARSSYSHRMQLSIRRPATAKLGAWVLVCLLLAGCGAEKKSLFEEEHELPQHWPLNLLDAAQKIESGLQRLESDHAGSIGPQAADSEAELRDLVEWIPEVAADSDLKEEQWIPIYETCEVMRKHLSTGDVTVSDIAEDFRKLQQQLIESWQLLPVTTASQSEVHSESSPTEGPLSESGSTDTK